MQKATFGAGCFWGVEAAFREVPGVVDTRVGYTGGTMANPRYEDVCAGGTGHTEAVEVTYNPSEVTYEALLRVFWDCHDPTTPHKAQYKSVIYYHTPAQQAAAADALEREQRMRKVTTEILPATTFYEAEEYHQQYYEKTGRGGCGVR